MIKRWILRILLGGAGGLLVLVAAGLATRAIIQHHIAGDSRITGPYAISSLESINLGGRRQYIFIRGDDRRLPVLLFLHGGPGGPLMFEARYFCGDLVKHFVVVNWDQRGAGKSYSPDIKASQMGIPQFENDAVQLIQLLRQRFGVDRVYLVGHSWGTILGALIARDHPNLLWAYVGAGQLVDVLQNEQISYDYTVKAAERAGNRQALSELATVKPPYKSIDQLAVERKWLWRFRKEQTGEPSDNGIQPLIRLLESPEYSLLDVWRTYKGLFWSLRVMWPELQTVDLFRQVQQIDVPVYLLLGKQDHQVPSKLAVQWLSELKAPHKQIIWFDSGHDMYLDEPERFQATLIKILAETGPRHSPGSPRVAVSGR